MYDGIDMSAGTQNPAMDWAFLDRLRKAWKGQLLIKGIDTREDARMAIEHARDVYTRRQEGVSIWVVRSSDVTASDPAEADSLFEPAKKKAKRAGAAAQLVAV